MPRANNNERVSVVPATLIEDFASWKSSLGKLGFEVDRFEYSIDRGIISAICEKNGSVHTVTRELKEILCR